MAGKGGTGDFKDGLMQMLSEMGPMKALPDADQKLLQALEQAILGWMQQQAQQAAQGAQQAAMAGAGGQQVPVPGPPGMMGSPFQGFGGASQAMQAGGSAMAGPQGAPNPDELNRVLSNAGGGG